MAKIFAEYTSMHARLQDRMAGDEELSQSGWLAAVQVTSRRFARELDIMAMMFAEARRCG